MSTALQVQFKYISELTFPRYIDKIKNMFLFFSLKKMFTFVLINFTAKKSLPQIHSLK